MSSRPSAPVTVALIEDHDATRAAIGAALAMFADRVRVVATFRDAESFLVSSPVRDASLDVALIDLGLPRMSGVQLIGELSVRAPHIHCVALTAFQSDADVMSALSQGAHGYLVKDEPTARIVSAVEEAAAGEHPMSSRVLGFLIAQAKKTPLVPSLTPREEELATALAEGLTYNDCSTRMGIGLGTVQTHVKRMYRKIGVNSRSEMRDWMRRHHR